MKRILGLALIATLSLTSACQQKQEDENLGDCYCLFRQVYYVHVLALYVLFCLVHKVYTATLPVVLDVFTRVFLI